MLKDTGHLLKKHGIVRHCHGTHTQLMFSISECSNQFFFFRDTTWNRLHYKFTCCKTMGIHFSLPSSATSKVYLLLFEIIKNGVKVTILVILKLLLFMVTPTCEQKDIILSTLFFTPFISPENNEFERQI